MGAIHQALFASGAGANPPGPPAIFENRGDQLTAGDGNLIDTWVDNIGTNDFLASGADRPTQRDNSLNGMPAAEFAAAHKMTLTTDPATTTNLTFLGVIKFPGGGQKTFLGGDSGPQIRINSSNRIQLLHGGVADLGSSSTNLSANTWYTIGVTYDGSIVRFYLNGAADGTNSIAHTMTNPVRYMGVRDSTSEFFNGFIAHALFFDSALASAEMTNGGGGRTDALRTLWAHY